MGIRIALGASRERVVTAVLSHGLLSAAIGGLIGGGAAVALARVFNALCSRSRRWIRAHRVRFAPRREVRINLHLATAGV